jgi:hypothetical protein
VETLSNPTTSFLHLHYHSSLRWVFYHESQYAYRHVYQLVQSEGLINLVDDRNTGLWLLSDHFPILSTLRSFVFDMGKLAQSQHKHNLMKKGKRSVLAIPICLSLLVTELNIMLDQQCSLHPYLREVTHTLYGLGLYLIKNQSQYKTKVYKATKHF